MHETNIDRGSDSEPATARDETLDTFHQLVKTSVAADDVEKWYGLRLFVRISSTISWSAPSAGHAPWGAPNRPVSPMGFTSPPAGGRTCGTSVSTVRSSPTFRAGYATTFRPNCATASSSRITIPSATSFVRRVRAIQKASRTCRWRFGWPMCVGAGQGVRVHHRKRFLSSHGFQFFRAGRFLKLPDITVSAQPFVFP